MREIIQSQLSIGELDIVNIKPNPKSRDEIDKIAVGLIHIYSTPELQKLVFAELKKIIPPNISKKNGRPGMKLWDIFVLAVFRNGCNIDYDKLHNLANNHYLIRQLLGHTHETVWSDKHLYNLQTLKDNVSLITDEIVNEINTIVVNEGHRLLPNKKKEEINCNADSFVVETNIHFPTDIGILFDSVRKAIQTTTLLCQRHGLSDCRQSNYHIRQLKRSLRQIQKAKRSGKAELITERHRDYIAMVLNLTAKIRITLDKINSNPEIRPIDLAQILMADKYLAYSEKQIDLITRRVFNNEKIPNSDKIFSVFEPHTRWISKGKAGKFVEFGLPVCIIKDQHGFILSHIVMEKTVDAEEAINILAKAMGKYSSVESCSYDKGYWSPSNYEKISQMVKKAVMPKKGRVSKAQQAEYDEKEYKKLRRQHSSVESAINGLEHSGLDKCLDHGIHGFKKYVAVSILARNLQTLGNMLIQKDFKKQSRKKTDKSKNAA